MMFLGSAQWFIKKKKPLLALTAMKYAVAEMMETALRKWKANGNI